MIVKATKVGSLYQLEYKSNHETLAEKADTKADMLHKRFGYLGVKSLQTFAPDVPFKFPLSSTRADEPLELVYSGLRQSKVNVKSENRAKYFLSLYDRTCYVCICTFCTARTSIKKNSRMESYDQ